MGSQEGPAAWDRTHVVSFAPSYRFGAGWSAGARLTMESGVPGVNDGDFRRELAQGQELPEDLSRTESPPRARIYFRADVRVEKSWRLQDEAALKVYLDLINLTGAQQVVRLSCDALGCVETSAAGLFLPSVGVQLLW